MRKILCIGYSVTERYGFVEEVNKLSVAASSGIELCKSGWGGHRIDSIAYMIDTILDNFSYDEVILEIFTSGLRTYGMPRIRAYLDEILTATAKRSIPVSFLNLYDREIDYRDDFLTQAIHLLSVDLNIPLLDIASFIQGLSDEKIDKLLLDTVHPSAAGEELYGSMLHAFIVGNAPQLQYRSAYNDRSRKLFAVSLPELSSNCSSSVYDKHGFPIKFIDIPQGEVLDIDLSVHSEIQALMLCYGPVTGRITITEVSSGESRTVMAYDSFSYYERTGVFTIEKISGCTFRIEQSDEVPDVELRKGVADLGPRTGKIAFLYGARQEATDDSVRSSGWIGKISGRLKEHVRKLFTGLFSRFRGLRLQ